MPRLTRSIHRNAAIVSCAGALALSLPACSSSNKASAPPASRATTTVITAPIAVQGRQLRAYLMPGGKGAAIITFLHETAQIGTGKYPALSVCAALQQKLAGQHLDYQSLQRLMKPLPPFAIGSFYTVALDREIALGLCASGKPVPGSATAANPYQTGLLRTLLAPYGLTI
jgi:hypothetical protein